MNNILFFYFLKLVCGCPATFLVVRTTGQPLISNTGDSAFYACAPKLWNSLPLNVSTIHCIIINIIIIGRNTLSALNPPTIKKPQRIRASTVNQAVRPPSGANCNCKIYIVKQL